MSHKEQGGRSNQYTRKKIQSYSYGLMDQIGKGYSSKVYRGRHDQSGQNVAVKVIDLKLLKNDINKELLNSQIEILKQLKNTPNILNLYDIYTTKNNTYIITELCVTDLNKIIKKGMQEDDAYLCMDSVIAGYLQIYKKGIVHRDLKPANILVTEDNKVKIADFGFGIKAQLLTKTSKYNVGSPLYMAPQSLKRNEYSFKSDIWSLGVIFYQILFNDTPWKAKTEKQLQKKIQTQTIESKLANKSITQEARQLLIKCLKVDKNSRLQPQQFEGVKLSLSISNILVQKNLNTAQKSNKCNESISQTLRTDKSTEKNVMFKSVSKNQNHRGPANPESYKTPLKNQTNQKIVSHQPKVSNLQREKKKVISKILISQVHFCRFLFKLVQKIRQSESKGLLKGNCLRETREIYKNYCGIIRSKIDKLVSFKQVNFISIDGYKEYKFTNDCEKVLKISKEYNERYKVQLEQYWNQPCILDSEATNCMIIAIYNLLEEAVQQMDNPAQEIGLLSKEVIILDYLITTRQLIQMIKSSPEGYERFARKSRIEEIVEGKTVDIHYELFKQIMNRAQKIMQKSQLVSFGGDLNGQQRLLVS